MGKTIDYLINVSSIKILLEEEDFQYYSEKKKKWILEKGEFLIKVGASSQDVRLENKIWL